uniref:Uncharacterized protein n=1 Tax=Arundo donax TaxID=35708 RepID=A0A0A9D949_ARUDO
MTRLIWMISSVLLMLPSGVSLFSMTHLPLNLIQFRCCVLVLVLES